jgi:hypothetical protein
VSVEFVEDASRLAFLSFPVPPMPTSSIYNSSGMAEWGNRELRSETDRQLISRSWMRSNTSYYSTWIERLYGLHFILQEERG